MSSDFDPDAFRLPHGTVVEKVALRSLSRSRGDGDETAGARFVKGPVYIDMLSAARGAHSDGPIVMMAVKNAYDTRRLPRDEWVTMSNQRCAAWGINDKARRRSVRALEAAGLLEVEWAPNRAPRVRPTSAAKMWGDRI